MLFSPHMCATSTFVAVLWDTIEPTDEWLMAQLPPLLKVGAAAQAGSLPRWHCGACP